MRMSSVKQSAIDTYDDRHREFYRWAEQAQSH